MGHNAGIVMQIVVLLGSVLVTLLAVLGALMLWQHAFRHRDFSSSMVGGSFWLIALICVQQGMSIVSDHFDTMQSSAFDAATYSAGRVCGVLTIVFFWVGLLASAFQSLRAKPRK